MSAVVNPNFVSWGKLSGQAVWATPDNGVAPELLPQDFPEETNLENEPEAEESVEENYWEPRHIRVPRSIMWGVIALLCLGAAALAVWGLAHSTMTYGAGAGGCSHDGTPLANPNRTGGRWRSSSSTALPGYSCPARRQHRRRH